MQLIAYTDYHETTLEILKQAYRIVEQMKIDNINEKEAILYIFNVMSANMLNEEDYAKYEEETEMILNPHDRYLINKTKEETKLESKIEIAKRMLKESLPITTIVKVTGLTEEQIQNAK